MSNLHSHSRGMDQFLHLQFLPRPPFSKASKTKKALIKFKNETKNKNKTLKTKTRNDVQVY